MIASTSTSTKATKTPDRAIGRCTRVRIRTGPAPRTAADIVIELDTFVMLASTAWYAGARNRIRYE